MQLVYILTLFALGLVILYAVLITAMKIKLKRLERRFGGKVTANLFRPAYILEDIELLYDFGSQFNPGNTRIRVLDKPKKPITFELSPKGYLFKRKGSTFEELYDVNCVVQSGFPFLTDDLKDFLAANANCGMNLVINQNDFILSTDNSPFYIKKIESCIELLLKIRNRIKAYESNQYQNGAGPG